MGTFNVIDYVNKGTAQGLQPYNPADPMASLYPIIADRNQPPYLIARDKAAWRQTIEAMLRARGLIYWKNTPGDCPLPSGPGGFGGGQVLGLTGAGAHAGLGALASSGVISGAATAGIGFGITAAIAGISELFTHHAQAVQQEQSVICSVASYVNDAIRKVDAAVAAGAISPGDGVNFMKQIVSQGKTALSGIEKTNPCNAACEMKARLDAHLDFSRQFYAQLSPIQVSALRPGQAPTAFGSLPGGVPSTANNPAPAPPVRSLPSVYSTPQGGNPTSGTVGPNDVNVNTGRRQQSSGITGKLAETPPTSGNSTWMIIAVILLAALVLSLI